MSETRLSDCSAGLSTRDRVYGSQVGAEGVMTVTLLVDRASCPDAGRCGAVHTCEAAFAAAGGGRVRSVVGIFAVDLSFGVFERSVFSMPPCFFSGLGVLERVRLDVGGARYGDVASCKLVVRDDSSLELFLLVYDGRGGGAGRCCGVGDGRGRSL